LDPGIAEAIFYFQFILSVESPIFWDVTPRSPCKANRRFGRTHRLHLQGRDASVKAGRKPRLVTSNLKREAMCCSETSVHFQRTTRHCIQEDSTLHKDRCENLKSYIGSLIIPAIIVDGDGANHSLRMP
jgi:hypothetical protein